MLINNEKAAINWFLVRFILPKNHKITFNIRLSLDRVPNYAKKSGLGFKLKKILKKNLIKWIIWTLMVL